MKNENGFTLLEIIIALIVVSILGLMVYQFVGTSIVESAVSVNRVKDQFELNEKIEELTAYYRNFVVISNNISQELGDTNLIKFKAHIESNYGEYIYTMADGNSSCRYILPDALDQGNRILKVSITNKKDADGKKLGQTVTALFTRW